VSVVSLWQTVIKQRVGKLNADMALLLEVIKRNGFRNLAITRTHLLTLADLPLHHRDPFDHLLIAQAISERATFLSDDHHVARYAVRALKCSAPM
jgi:PIN domain nuclease of toxin-antitoxin system